MLLVTFRVSVNRWLTACLVSSSLLSGKPEMIMLAIRSATSCFLATSAMASRCEARRSAISFRSSMTVVSKAFVCACTVVMSLPDLGLHCVDFADGRLQGVFKLVEPGAQPIDGRCQPAARSEVSDPQRAVHRAGPGWQSAKFLDHRHPETKLVLPGEGPCLGFPRERTRNEVSFPTTFFFFFFGVGNFLVHMLRDIISPSFQGNNISCLEIGRGLTSFK